MSRPSPQPLFFTQRFQDFDEFAEMVRAWDLDLMQLECGPFRGDFLQMVGDHLQLGRFKIDCRHEQRGAPPPGLKTFGIMSPKSSPVVHRNRKILYEEMVVFPPGEEMDVQAYHGFEAFTLSFTEDLLESLTQQMGLPPIEALLVEKDYVTCHPQRFTQLQSFLGDVCRRVSSGFFNPSSQGMFECVMSELPRYFLNTIAEVHPIVFRPSSWRRNEAFKRIKEYLAECSDGVPTIGDLCKVAQVSERTLEYAFQERYGIAPNTYLRFYRLKQVRRALRAADPAVTTVTEVATNWGFWHFGHFTTHYREAFGELPSATLKNPKFNRPIS